MSHHAQDNNFLCPECGIEVAVEIIGENVGKCNICNTIFDITDLAPPAKIRRSRPSKFDEDWNDD